MINKENKTVICPHCKSNDIWKFGKYHNRQRYRCKNCQKTFTSFTKQPWSYTKKSINNWKEYIKFMDFKYTLRECAKKLNMSLATAFYWRHKLLNSIYEKHKNERLTSEVGILKSKIKENRKGSRNIVTCPKNLHFSYAIDNDDKFIIDLCDTDISADMYIKIYKKHMSKNAIILRTNNTIINRASDRFNKIRIKKKGMRVFSKFGKYKSWLFSFKGIASKNHTLYHYYFLNFTNLRRCFLI